MSKKNKKKESTPEKEKHDITKFCAFWGLAIVAVLFIVTGILTLLGRYFEINTTVISVFDTIAKVALLIAVGLPAYSYVNKKGKNWLLLDCASYLCSWRSVRSSKVLMI